MADALLTLKEIADYLRVDKFTVYRLMTKRKLPAYKVGGQWRFDKDMVEKWLQQHLNTPSRVDRQSSESQQKMQPPTRLRQGSVRILEMAKQRKQEVPTKKKRAMLPNKRKKF